MHSLSLKRTYQIYSLLFLVVVLAINSIIPLCMMCTGMFSMHEITLHNAGQAAEALFKQGKTELDTDNISVYADWQKVPEAIRSLNHNQAPTADTGIIYQHFDGPYIDALSVHYTASGQPLYIWLHYNASHDLVFAPKNMTAIILLVVMTFAVVAILSFHLQSKVITPVYRISQAIKQHDWQGITVLNLPAQGYAELQSIVDALHHSLLKLQQAQQRELNFLRYASHELRTPVAICQSSFELLTLQHGALHGPVLAASQATTQMKLIIETLLWSTNKTSTSLDKQSIDLGQLLQQVITEQEYAQGKLDTAELKCDHHCVMGLHEPLKMILNNLVRNALEYGDQYVCIIQHKTTIIIANPMLENNQHGFGLGLMLVNRLAKQLEYGFSTHKFNNYFYSVLNLDNDHVISEAILRNFDVTSGHNKYRLSN